MRWFKPNLKSIHALFGGHPHPEDETTLLDLGIDDIRVAMLALIEGMDDRQVVLVERRIRYAVDVLALWYLRGDLMAALATTLGEAGARQQVQRITQMFQGMLPGSLNSRPSPLMG